MSEDRFTNTPQDAARFEAHRAEADNISQRPTLLEALRDEAVWEPGDPCFACGSTETVNIFDGVLLLGAECFGCGRSDYDDD